MTNVNILNIRQKKMCFYGYLLQSYISAPELCTHNPSARTMNLNTTNPQLMKYLLLTATLPLLALLAGCKKEDQIPYPLSELPPATQTGARTFGCLINGKPWVAIVKPAHPWLSPLRSTYDEEHYGLDYNRRLTLSALRVISSYDWNNDSIYSSIGFNINPIIGEGHYDIRNLQVHNLSHIVYEPGPTKRYELDTLAPFHIHITKLDTVNKIVSGTFEMDLIEIDDSLDVLYIRHGRFDAWYQKQ
jgi:hypothetical protein